MSVLSLLEAAAAMKAIQKDIALAEQVIVGRAAIMIRDSIRNQVIGHEHSYWQPLAASTLAEKAANTPLLETGSFRNSIGASIGIREARVGTNDFRGPYFEFGTSKMPPRPFLWPGWMAVEKDVLRMAGQEMRHAFRALGGHAMQAAELFHLLRELAHIAKEIANQFQESVKEPEQKRH